VNARAVRKVAGRQREIDATFGQLRQEGIAAAAPI
jgi:hypothetical protein